MYTYSVVHDREFMGSSAYAVGLPLGEGSENSVQKSYGVLLSSRLLVECLQSGVIDIIASSNGIFLLTVRINPVRDHQDNNLKLFVYNPISKDVRALPATHFAPQKLAMIFCRGGDGISGYKIYSLGRSYRPGTTNLLYSFEVFDSAQGHLGWQFVSHVRANLSGSGDMSTGSETQVMGYVNSKSACNRQGFLYWMPSLDHMSRAGRHAELASCHISTGFFYRLPGVPFKTTFASMWPWEFGLMLVCGVAQGDDLSCTCGVEIWELVQGDESSVEDEKFYGSKCPPPGTRWQPFNRMELDVWNHLTCRSTGRIACAVAMPFVFVVAENEEDNMAVYDTNSKVWKLTRFLPLLSMLFCDKHPDYFEIYPWMVTFTPNENTDV